MANNSSHIKKIEEFVIASVGNKDLSLDALCEELNLSRSQVYRIIKAETGLSTTIFIRKIKIEAAKELLVETNANISEISYQVGIDNPQNFSQYFKQFEHISPTEFREKAFQKVENEAPKNTHKATKKGLSKRNVFAITSLFVLVLAASVYGYFTLFEKDNNAKPIADKTLAVLRFENQTNDKNNDLIGYMAMDWISSALLAAKEIKVMKAESISLQEANKAYFKENGAEVFIRGRFYKLKDDQIAFTCDIVNARTEQIIYTLPTITGSINEPLPILESIQQQILGYYELEKSYKGKRMPRYDAYKAYVKAVAEPAKYPHIDNIKNLKQAIALDSLFLDPYYKIFIIGHWTMLKTESGEALNFLKKHTGEMSEYQLLNYQALKAVDEGDPLFAAQNYLELYQKYGNIKNGEEAAREFRFANYLEASVNLYEDFSKKYTEPKSHEAFGSYIDALYALGKFEKVKELIQSNLAPPSEILAPMVYLKILINENNLEKFNAELNYYLKQPLTFDVYNAKVAFLSALLHEMYRLNKKDWLAIYAPRQIELINQQESDFLFKNVHLASYYIFIEDYENAYTYGKKVWEEDHINVFQESVGIALFKMGKLEKLEKFKKEIQKRQESFPGATSYAIAVMTAQIDKKSSIPWFEKSIKEGYEFDWYCFRNDAFLNHLMDYEPFLKIIKPKTLASNQLNTILKNTH